MIVGIPKEIMSGEARVAATPETVKKFIQDGMTVLVEAGAGVKSFYYDEQYKEAGAEMVSDAEHLYQRAGLILKVKEPLFNDNVGKHEVEMMHKGQYLVTFIHPASPVNHKMVKQLAEQGVIGLTLDSIPRISRAQNMDALTSMSTCAGYKGIIMAADDLSVFMPQMFTAVGMLKPANVLVIGTGVAGLQALATAKRLGAVTYAMDIRPAANEQAKSLGAKIIETGVPEELAVGKGGYAQKLPDGWLAKEREVLAGVLKDMDIVFCSALIPGKVAPILITEEMVESMKNGAVIVDISIDQGGNCAVTPAGKKEMFHNVMVQGIKNIPGLIPTSSTWMFSQNVYNLVKYLSKDGQVVLDLNDEIVRSILVTHNGEIVHEGAREAMGL
ncbi:MAG TPA: NAD(P) transhydrogenase subunit alpha [Petrimonas sp.]|uniref:NAD(P) transhydrogenase subunit alpha n=1 Tax=Petrimonas sp. TaxID=2023866 RepID=UPI000966762D|nr:NAD(P) transhydrogenase subunit alpha [Petrimonas sp.]MEA4980640.1 NAD(P) transhydrogenase subunit alpha [Petrimonas sp.]OJV34719.1 MAG: NADP oxidoreductase [Bacteroidia bacterium 43-41]HHV85199.1 NAD(P) transhydrogenase subunit alpha [Petrimonas sp.]